MYSTSQHAVSQSYHLQGISDMNLQRITNNDSEITHKLNIKNKVRDFIKDRIEKFLLNFKLHINYVLINFSYMIILIIIFLKYKDQDFVKIGLSIIYYISNLHISYVSKNLNY